MGSNSTMEEKKLIWNFIWRFNVKKKVQHFLWRCINNNLLVLQNVQKREIVCSAIHSQCEEMAENVEYVMFECSKAMTA